MVKIESTTESIESKGGLILIGGIAQKTGMAEIGRGTAESTGSIITCLFGMIAQGYTTFESLKLFCRDTFFKAAMNLGRSYSAETIRLYLEKLIPQKEEIIAQIRKVNLRLLKRVKLTRVYAKHHSYIPVDVDTTPMDNSGSKKEGVGRTYKGFDGYHPILAYVGNEGYLLDCELRPGTQHCQNGTPAFIGTLCAEIKEAWPGKHFLFRFDSGNDSRETIEAVGNHFFIIKRNLRRESDWQWLILAQNKGTAEMPRAGKTVWRGITDELPGGKEMPPATRCVFEVTLRAADRDGFPYLIPDIEINTWWTNISDDAEDVINLYHAHGTSEQYHSELKTDIGLERFPSGKFAVNEMVLAVAMTAFNALRFLGQTALASNTYPAERRKVSRKRLGKVIAHIIQMAGKFVNHAGSYILRIYYHDPWYPVFVDLTRMIHSW